MGFAPGDPTSALAAHQRLVMALLRSPALPGEPGTRRLVQTHISSLLLAGDRVYKLRKPLALPVLDFSPAELRRIDCEHELALNRRTAPSLYLGVQPVTGSIDAPVLGPGAAASEPIDWVLVMRRFDDAGLLGRMAHEGRLGPATVDALAQAVAAFHASLPRSPPSFGEPAFVRARALENLDALGSSTALASEQARVQRLRAWTEAAFEHHAARLAARREQGFVREGHGDLHLDNIVLLDGEPRPFDAIEFNDSLRHTDIVADMAFTFMDLWRQGLPRLAWRLASRWAEGTGDAAGLALLRFFGTYRALVRAKVALLRHEQGDPGAVTAALRDLQVAEAVAGVAPPAPPARLVMTCGLSGSGKSTVALELAQALGAIRLRSDVERKRLHGLAPLARPTAAEARRLYDRPATRLTFDHLASLSRGLLAEGLTVVVDAAFLRREERDRFRAMAAALGVPALVVECRAPAEVLRQRLVARALSGQDPSDADVAVLERQLGLQQPPGADEPTLVIDTADALPVVAARCEALAQDLLGGACAHGA